MLPAFPLLLPGKPPGLAMPRSRPNTQPEYFPQWMCQGSGCQSCAEYRVSSSNVFFHLDPDDFASGRACDQCRKGGFFKAGALA
jgi:hypothetical protein